MNDPEDYLIAGLAVLVNTNDSLNHGILPESFTLETAARAIQDRIGVAIKPALLSATFDRLTSLEIAEKIEDPYTPTFYTLSEQSLQDYNEMYKADRGTPYGKASYLGLSWIKTALGGLQSTDAIQRSSRIIPALDATIELNDYQSQKLREALDEIAADVETSNEIGGALGDNRVSIANELRAGKQLIFPGKIRLAALFAVLMKPLRYLAKEFAGKAAGELASSLVAELLKLLHH